MIISRTPYRISFFGGGTDYPVWFREHGGAVLATTIDKYCYISCRYLPPFFDHKTRIAYSKIEHVKTNADIGHPAVKGTVRARRPHGATAPRRDGPTARGAPLPHGRTPPRRLPGRQPRACVRSSASARRR